MSSSFFHTNENILLSGPAGVLEAMTTWPRDVVKPQGVGIICHPHPLYQGTMHNKVVTTIAKTLDALGLATVRFNYRGVGKSEGSYGEMQGEMEDLLAVKAWVQRQLPALPVWLAGFSFGGFIAASVSNQSEDVVQLITIAPAVNYARFDTFTEIQCPWLLIQGDKDEVVPYEAVQQFAAHPPSPLKMVTLEGASHFFHGRLGELAGIIQREVMQITR